MARLRIAYIGGGSTRAAGTMAGFIEQGENFTGSEIVLIDLDRERLELIRRLGERIAASKGVELTVSATTDRRAGLDGCDAVLTSYRPGGFAARVLDERIPLSHGVIGQETQGPGGFFMALRSIHVMKGILEDMAVACPDARIFNYTNPVNVVAQAVTDHSDVPFVSLCEGPIVFPEEIAAAAGLDPALLDVVSVGLNHGSWSVRHTLRRAGPAAAGAGRVGAARRRPRAQARDAPDAAPGVGDGRAAERVLPVLLLRARGPARAHEQGDDPRRGHPRLGAGLLGALRGAGGSGRARARPRPLARRHRRARAGDRLHGRRLQRPRRDAAGQRPQPRLGPRLPGLARGRDARPLRRHGRPAAADAGAPDAPARPRRGARRVPAGGGRRRLVGRRPRRGPGAGGASAGPLGRPRRASCTPSWPTRIASTCRTGCVPA